MKVVSLLAAAAFAVPGAVQVPDGNKVFLVAHAVGVQIYACNGGAWTFVAPRAELYRDNGTIVATHFAGPTWEARDGSRVVGRVIGRATVDSNAIPWLLLEAASTTDGRFGHTTYIQRLATTGGVAPTAPCTAGDTAEIPYTADYAFWKEKK
jgi:Protein of unknown function (DUF3455)